MCKTNIKYPNPGCYSQIFPRNQLLKIDFMLNLLFQYSNTLKDTIFKTLVTIFPSQNNQMT